MTLVDSHCHLNFDPLAAELPALLANAAANDVKAMLCVAVNMEDFPQIRALAAQWPQIYASVGVHPTARDGHDPSTAELVDIARHNDIVAIGETGLDYFRCEGDLDWQHQRFQRHIEAAREVKKPLIIHTREAADDTLKTLKDCAADEAGAVIHCFTEDWRIASMALDLGFYISLSGIVTFKSASAIQDVAKRMPLERMLVETDAPYLAPVPYRGKTNQPAYVRHVAEFVAALRGIPCEALAEQTTDNFYRLFSTATPPL